MKEIYRKKTTIETSPVISWDQTSQVFCGQAPSFPSSPKFKISLFYPQILTFTAFRKPLGIQKQIA